MRQNGGRLSACRKNLYMHDVDGSFYTDIREKWFHNCPVIRIVRFGSARTTLSNAMEPAKHSLMPLKTDNRSIIIF